jgi:hypothetical protein
MTYQKDNTIDKSYLGKVISVHKENAKRVYTVADIYVTRSEVTGEVVNTDYLCTCKKGNETLKILFNYHRVKNARIIEEA